MQSIFAKFILKAINKTKMQNESMLEKTKSLFEKKQNQPVDSGYLNRVNDIGIRLKVIEDRHISLRRKTQITEQNLINTNKKISTEVKTISSDINEIRSALFDITTKINEIKDEISRCAKKDELDLLNKYISYWEPLNYVTADDVEKIAREILNKK